MLGFASYRLMRGVLGEYWRVSLPTAGRGRKPRAENLFTYPSSHKKARNGLQERP